MPTTSSTHPNHEISAWIRIDPKRAADKILAYLREAKMHKGHAAEAIGCAHSTLIQWIKQLDLGATIDRLDAKARKEGWHHGQFGGRPKGTTVESGRAKPRTPKTKAAAKARSTRASASA